MGIYDESIEDLIDSFNSRGKLQIEDAVEDNSLEVSPPSGVFISKPFSCVEYEILERLGR